MAHTRSCQCVHLRRGRQWGCLVSYLYFYTDWVHYSSFWIVLFEFNLILFCKWRDISFQYIDKSVLVGNGPIVTFIRNYIRDSSGVAVSSLVRLFVQKYSFLRYKKKITRWLENKIHIFTPPCNILYIIIKFGFGRGHVWRETISPEANVR